MPEGGGEVGWSLCPRVRRVWNQVCPRGTSGVRQVLELLEPQEMWGCCSLTARAERASLHWTLRLDMRRNDKMCRRWNTVVMERTASHTQNDETRSSFGTIPLYCFNKKNPKWPLISGTFRILMVFEPVCNFILHVVFMLSTQIGT